MSIQDRMAQMQADECRECGHVGVVYDSCPWCVARRQRTESRRAEVRAWMDRDLTPRREWAHIDNVDPSNDLRAYVHVVGWRDFEPATCRIVPAPDGSFGWVVDHGGDGPGRPLAGSNSRDVDKIDARATMVRENKTEGK